MIYLRSFDQYNHVIELASKKSIETVDHIKPHGWFKKVRSQYSCLYTNEKRLILAHGAVEVSLSPEHRAKNASFFGIGRFSLYRNNTVILRFFYFYSLFWWVQLIYDIGYLEKEDHVWGLFLSNVINSSERRQIHIRAHLEQA